MKSFHSTNVLTRLSTERCEAHEVLITTEREILTNVYQSILSGFALLTLTHMKISLLASFVDKGEVFFQLLMRLLRSRSVVSFLSRFSLDSLARAFISERKIRGVSWAAWRWNHDLKIFVQRNEKAKLLRLKQLFLMVVFTCVWGINSANFWNRTNVVELDFQWRGQAH